MAFWFGVLFLVLGIILLGMIPLVILTLRRDPMSLLREQWHDVSSPGCAYALGALVLLIALAGGVWSLSVAIRLLF
jgi:hypothetical protein